MGHDQVWQQTHYGNTRDRKKKKRQKKKIFLKKMTSKSHKLPNLDETQIYICILEAQQIPNRIISKRPTWSTLQLKWRKSKTKKESWKQKVTIFHIISKKINSWLPSETMEVKRQWNWIFKVLKGKIKTVKQKSATYSSITKKTLMFFQINKSWGNHH